MYVIWIYGYNCRRLVLLHDIGFGDNLRYFIGIIFIKNCIFVYIIDLKYLNNFIKIHKGMYSEILDIRRNKLRE
jgi:hypothetical protein